MTELSLSLDTIRWLLPTILLYISIMSKSASFVFITALFSSFAFFYLAVTTLEWIYAFASVVTISLSGIIAFKLLGE